MVLVPHRHLVARHRAFHRIFAARIRLMHWTTEILAVVIPGFRNATKAPSHRSHPSLELQSALRLLVTYIKQSETRPMIGPKSRHGLGAFFFFVGEPLVVRIQQCRVDRSP